MKKTYKDEDTAGEEGSSESAPVVQNAFTSVATPDTGVVGTDAVEELNIHGGEEEE